MASKWEGGILKIKSKYTYETQWEFPEGYTGEVKFIISDMHFAFGSVVNLLPCVFSVVDTFSCR